ncbi:MAG: hypothetical protein K8T20_17405, partial [Planctomycetes bacterium]|nr:hypothetical protein [Planctomycetota bacterium]
EDGTLRLWDESKPAEVFRAPGAVLHAAISPDGRWIAAATGDSGLLWASDAPTAPRPLTGHAKPVTALSFSPDSRHLVVGDAAGRIVRWAVATLEPDGERQFISLDPLPPGEPTKPPPEVGEIVHHPDGKRVAVRAHAWLHILSADLAAEYACHEQPGLNIGEGTLDADWKRCLGRLFTEATSRDVDTGARPVVYGGHEYNIEFACYSPDGRRVLTGGRDRTAIVWDSEPGDCLPAYRWSATRPDAIASPGGSMAMVLGESGKLEIHDNATGRLVRALDWSGARVSGRFFADGHRFAVNSGKGDCVHVGDVERGWLFDADVGTGTVWWFRESANGEWLLVKNFEQAGRIWHVADGKAGPAIDLPPHTYDFVSVSDDGKMLALANSSAAEVIVYGVAEGRVLARLRGHSGWTIGTGFAPDGTVLTTGMDATVRAWNPGTGAVLRSGRWPLIQETWIVPSPTGRLIALNGGNTTRFYTLDTLDEFAALPRGFEWPGAFSPDGAFAVARRRGACVRLPINALAFAESVLTRGLTPLEERGISVSRAEADAYAEDYTRRHPKYESLLLRGERALREGRWEEALRESADAAARLPAHPLARELEARSHAVHASTLPAADPRRTAAVEEGLAALEAAVARGYRDVAALEGDETLAPLRSGPRWEELLSRAKRPPSSE